ncbi:MAG: FtsH protease activity modulator HflK [Deltaproteobacteria bacterium]|nr:FtsH protease activity modulator HflK [Deltaproteobacteria bacterium]
MLSNFDDRQWPQKGPSIEDVAKNVKEFFKKTQKGRRGFLIFIIIVLGLWLASGIYMVSPAEEGVVRQFGKMVRVTSSGLRYHLPWPIEKVDTPKVTEIKRLEIGFRTIDPGPPARYQFIERESLMLTGDENIVDAQIIVQYKIKDAPHYLFKVKDPRGTLRDASEAALRQIIGANTIDDALTVGRLRIQMEIKDVLQRIMDGYESGLLITEVKLQTVRPPKQVEAAFKDVVSAKEDRERVIYEARGYQEDIIPKAKGKAAQMIKGAEAYRAERVARAKGDATRFLSVLKEYKKAKDVTKKRLYLETMEEILPNVKKFVIDSQVGGNVLQFLPLETKEKTIKKEE